VSQCPGGTQNQSESPLPRLCMEVNRTNRPSCAWCLSEAQCETSMVGKRSIVIHVLANGMSPQPEMCMVLKRTRSIDVRAAERNLSRLRTRQSSAPNYKSCKQWRRPIIFAVQATRWSQMTCCAIPVSTQTIHCPDFLEEAER
jgi:hypothetical protein